jgi:glycosyltransferase involved in cell wall biosynthesis
MPEPAKRLPIATAALSLVLPAHNAGADLDALLAPWVEFLERRQRPYEILLVNDGSTDDTGARADELARQHKTLHVHHHATPLGFGAALRTGARAARHPLLAYGPCDRQYQAADLQRLLDMIDQVDVVAGYRLSQTVPDWLHTLHGVWRLAARVLFGLPLEPLPCWLGWSGLLRRRLIRTVFGVHVHDVGCLFALLRRGILDRFPLQSDSSFAHVELLAKANFTNCWIHEVPVHHQPPAAPGPVRERRAREAWRLFNHPRFGKAADEPPPPQPAAV